MLEEKDLKALEELFDKKLEPIKADIANIKNDVSTMKEDIEKIEFQVDTVYEWVDKIDLSNKETRRAVGLD